ncbi:MAG: class I SAM-dependent methyltransferase [Spirosomataceae bacterium]
MNIVNKIVSVILAIFGIIGTIASISSADNALKPYLIVGSILLFLGGLLWIFNSFVGFKTFQKIVKGSRQIGITNITPNRLKGDNKIGEKLQNSKHIRIFAVTGNQIITDFGPDLKIALHTMRADIKIIFSTHDDYFDEYTNTQVEPYGDIIRNCTYLVNCFNDASKIASDENKIVGTLEIGFFKSHNRLPQILCDSQYGAFHISLPPKESNQSVLFELKGSEQSIISRDKKLLLDFLTHFDKNWTYLVNKNATGKILDYAVTLNRVINSKDLIKRNEIQKRITEGAKFNFNNKRDDRNLSLGKDTNIINHHFGIGNVENIEKLTQEQISLELNRLELNQIDTLINHIGYLSKNDFVLDVGCGRGGTSISIAEKFKCNVTGINVADYQIEFAKKIVKDKNISNVNFLVMDFLNISLPNTKYNCVVLNEVSMYACYLETFLGSLKSVMTNNGKIVIATWCMADDYTNEIWASKINQHYDVLMHTKDEYIEALSQFFNNVQVADYSASAKDYFTLRKRWIQRSEIEDAYLQGFNEQKIQYLFITAEV